MNYKVPFGIFGFPIGIMGQVWYLIVSIPDLCTLTYFKKILTVNMIVFISDPFTLIFSHHAC